MSAAVLDRPVAEGPELDLRGLDFATRRRRLFTALRDLPPTGELRLTSAHADDLYWLRYEMEARIDRRYSWSPAGEEPTGQVHTVVHPCPPRATPDRRQACSGTPGGNVVAVSPSSRQR